MGYFSYRILDTEEERAVKRKIILIFMTVVICSSIVVCLKLTEVIKPNHKKTIQLVKNTLIKEVKGLLIIYNEKGES